MSMFNVPPRVDENRFEHAIDTADFIASHHDADGNYVVDEHWGPEGELYRALSTWALLDAYELIGKETYLDTARTLLERYEHRQLDEGGWTIALGEDGIEFTMSEEQRQDTRDREDPILAGAALKAIADYQEITGTDEFTEMGNRAFDHLMDLWDNELGTVREDRDRHLAALRSNPDAYHFLFLRGFDAWEPYAPDTVADILPQIREFVKEVFEDFDTETMPLMYGYHAAVLMEQCDDDYVKNTIRPGLDEFLYADTFRVDGIPGGYGHHDGARGIVADEAHMRSNAGLAIAMRRYDIETGTRTYQDSDLYADVAGWIDGMKAENDDGYYEYQTADGRRRGKGAGGQYLPCFWIFGRV